MTKEEKEEELSDMLYEALRSFNQEGGIKSYELNEKTGEFHVVFDVVEIDEDGYIGFSGY